MPEIIAQYAEGPVKTEGQRLLLQVPYTLTQVANLVGVSRQLISYWRTGRQLPVEAKRRKLQTELGIPERTWVQVPTVPLPAPGSPRPGTIAAGLGRGAALSSITTAQATAGKRPRPTESPEEAPPKANGSSSHPEDVQAVEAPVAAPVARSRGKVATPTTMEGVEALLDEIREARNTPNLIATECVRLSDAECRLLALRHRLEKEAELVEDRIVREHPKWLQIRSVLARVLVEYPEAARAVAAALKELDL